MEVSAIKIWLVAIAAPLPLACVPPDFGSLRSQASDQSLRQDLSALDSGNPLREWANSTASLVHRTRLLKEEESGDPLILASPTGMTFNLCPNEDFQREPTASFCTGILVSTRILVTAGNCIPNKDICDETAFIFNLEASKTNAGALMQAQKTDIYYCKRLIQQKRSKEFDFAIIELDREVLDREPISFSNYRTPYSNPETPPPVTVIGNPMGQSTKITSGVAAQPALNNNFFEINVSRYPGDNGSLVVIQKSEQSREFVPIGYLIGGEIRFDTSAEETDENVVNDGPLPACYPSKLCSGTSCLGGQAASLTQLREFMP